MEPFVSPSPLAPAPDEDGAAVIRFGVPVAGALAAGARPHAAPPTTAGGAEDPGAQDPFYYSSKYARLDALPRALDYGKTECLASVRTYIGYVFDPPDGEGDPVENARHLRGACARLRIGPRSDNAALLLLDAFSRLAIEASPRSLAPTAPVADNSAVRAAVRLYRTGYRRFLASEPWPEVLTVLAVFADRLGALHPHLRPLLEGLHQECVLYRTVCLLRDVNAHLLDEPSA